METETANSGAPSSNQPPALAAPDSLPSTSAALGLADLTPFTNQSRSLAQSPSATNQSQPSPSPSPERAIPAKTNLVAGTVPASAAPPPVAVAPPTVAPAAPISPKAPVSSVPVSTPAPTAALADEPGAEIPAILPSQRTTMGVGLILLAASLLAASFFRRRRSGQGHPSLITQSLSQPPQ